MTKKPGNGTSVTIPVTFFAGDLLTPEIVKLAAETDRTSDTGVEDNYSIEQAVTAALHGNPRGLFDLLDGWVVDVPWGDLPATAERYTPQGELINTKGDEHGNDR